MTTPNFPNGFPSWYETHHEVVEFISAVLAKGDDEDGLIQKTSYAYGTGGIYELAYDWTNTFEELNAGRKWDGEFYDEIRKFCIAQDDLTTFETAYKPSHLDEASAAQPAQAEADKVWNVYSPDGFSISREDTYETEAEAREAFKAWSKRYEAQGYYSSSQHGRIDLAYLENYCLLVQEDKPTEDEEE